MTQLTINDFALALTSVRLHMEQIENAYGPIDDFDAELHPEGDYCQQITTKDRIMLEQLEKLARTLTAA